MVPENLPGPPPTSTGSLGPGRGSEVCEARGFEDRLFKHIVTKLDFLAFRHPPPHNGPGRTWCLPPSRPRH